MKLLKSTLATSLAFLGGMDAVLAEKAETLPAGTGIQNQIEQRVERPLELEIGDGVHAVTISDEKDLIVPPEGWNLRRTPQLSLVMESPKPAFEYEKELFRQNITVVLRNRPLPMDQTSLDQFQGFLEKKVGEKLASFQILDAKLYDRTPEQKAIVVYTGYLSGKIEMNQMHILMSGSEKSYHFTYTDLAKRFLDDPAYQKSWDAIHSANIEGDAPSRYGNLALYGLSALGLLGLYVLYSLRSRRVRAKQYEKMDKELYDLSDSGDDMQENHGHQQDGYADDAISMQTYVWNLQDMPQTSEVRGLTTF